MGRLTTRNFENETCCAVGGCIAYEDCYECPGFQDILAKLAHYEDLEEAGRLVILPAQFDLEGFCNQLSGGACPHHYLLPDSEDCAYGITCEKCWEAALKGAE